MFEDIAQAVANRDISIRQLTAQISDIRYARATRKDEKAALDMTLGYLDAISAYGINSEGVIADEISRPSDLWAENRAIKSLIGMLALNYAGAGPNSLRNAVLDGIADVFAELQSIDYYGRQEVIMSLELTFVPLEQAHLYVKEYIKRTKSKSVTVVGNHVRMSMADAWSIFGDRDSTSTTKAA